MNDPPIRVDKKFKEMLNMKYPGISNPERTRRVLDELYKKDELAKKIEEIMFGKEKKKK